MTVTRAAYLPRLRRSLRSEDGQSLVETAISLYMMMLMVFAVFEFSMLAYTYSVLYEAVHQGVRYAEVHGYDTGNTSTGCTTASSNSVIAAVKKAASSSLHNMSAMQVSVCYPDTTGAKPLSLVQVTVQYTYIPYVNVPGVSQTMSVSSNGRILY